MDSRIHFLLYYSTLYTQYCVVFSCTKVGNFCLVKETFYRKKVILRIKVDIVILWGESWFNPVHTIEQNYEMTDSTIGISSTKHRK